jgi:hypothetical protein
MAALSDLSPAGPARHNRLRAGVTVTTVLTALLLVSGCSSVGDSISQQAAKASCAVVEATVNQISDDATTAIGSITVDPHNAVSVLQNAETALSILAINSDAIGNAQTTLGQLRALAERAAAGELVDTNQLAELQDQLHTQLATVTGCGAE